LSENFLVDLLYLLNGCFEEASSGEVVDLARDAVGVIVNGGFYVGVENSLLKHLRKGAGDRCKRQSEL
jgi:hypothetical protein